MWVSIPGYYTQVCVCPSQRVASMTTVHLWNIPGKILPVELLLKGGKCPSHLGETQGPLATLMLLAPEALQNGT